MESMPPELLPGTLHLLILRTLTTGPLHGYAIAKRIKETSSGALEVEEGSLYPALSRMAVKGWISAEWGVSETNRKARFYTLTREGRKQLERETEAFQKVVGAIQLVLKHA
jgi:PadR family transcriptional regulator